MHGKDDLDAKDHFYPMATGIGKAEKFHLASPLVCDIGSLAAFCISAFCISPQLKDFASRHAWV